MFNVWCIVEYFNYVKLGFDFVEGVKCYNLKGMIFYCVFCIFFVCYVMDYELRYVIGGVKYVVEFEGLKDMVVSLWLCFVG